MKMIIDASVLLMAYFPDESYHMNAHKLLRNFALGKIELFAPAFSCYEILNACLVAARRGRISTKKAIEISEEILDTGIPGSVEDRSASDILDVCISLGISVYDGAYVALAKHLKIPFITADKRLYEHIRIPTGYVLWIGDY
jgi:predicted nucleic acid-binding protein